MFLNSRVTDIHLLLEHTQSKNFRFLSDRTKINANKVLQYTLDSNLSMSADAAAATHKN